MNFYDFMQLKLLVFSPPHRSLAHDSIRFFLPSWARYLTDDE